MRIWHLWILLGLLMSAACSSYEEQRKVESALAQSVNRFHEQLNNEEFNDIYSEADPSLRNRIDEATFTSQLKSAHDQLGKVSARKTFLLSSRAWSDLQWARTFGREQRVSHREMPDSELIQASEIFEWKIENDQPKLASYEFRFVCRRPCTVGIGP